jgi:hypothetical protein
MVIWHIVVLKSSEMEEFSVMLLFVQDVKDQYEKYHTEKWRQESLARVLHYNIIINNIENIRDRNNNKKNMEISF